MLIYYYTDAVIVNAKMIRVRIIYVPHNLRVFIMSSLYNALVELCEHKGITPYRMCKDTGIQPSVMTDLKMGRRRTVKAETAAKLANYFHVSVEYLLGNEPNEKPHADENDMGPKEKLLLENFRKLTPEMQEFVLSSVQAQSDKLNKEQNQ